MTTTPSTYLCVERTRQYVGSTQAVFSLLETLEQSLKNDLPRIQERLAAGDLQGANAVLHQIKGFAPVFCTETLVAEVTRVETMSKGTDLQAVCDAYAQLQPQLLQLLTEVQACLTAPR